MRRALMFGICFALSCSQLWAFEEKELKPVRPGVEHMWYCDDGGADICFFQYKYVKPDVEKMLEDFFPGYVFFVGAVWNKSGKENVPFDGSTHTFRMFSREKKVYGNIDPWEGFIQRIDAGISKINQELRYAGRLESDWQIGINSSDEIAHWANAHGIKGNKGLKNYKASLEYSAFSLQNLSAVMKGFNCAVGEKAWAIVPVHQESKNLPLNAVSYMKLGKEIEMKRVGLTKPMIDKLEIKQREFGARFQ